MTDPASPDYVPISLHHAPALPDHLRGSPGQMPTSPDHVFAFLDDDPTLDTEEDQDMDIDVEDPKEDQEIDFADEDDEWEDEEDWLMAPVTPPTATSPVRLVRPATPPSPLSTHAPLPVDSIMLPNYQTTTSVTTPWIPPTLRRFQHERDHVHNTFEVRGPSFAAPDALHPIRCPIFMVASRVAFHHQELEALHVRLDSKKGWRARIGCAGCCSDKGYRAADVQTLRATLEDTRVEVLDLRTRLSASERSKMSLITRLLRMEESISALTTRNTAFADR
ncbi:hypothetical protein Tco_1118739 [Tanacetum coccineum]